MEEKKTIIFLLGDESTNRYNNVFKKALWDYLAKQVICMKLNLTIFVILSIYSGMNTQIYWCENPSRFTEELSYNLNLECNVSVNMQYNIQCNILDIGISKL